MVKSQAWRLVLGSKRCRFCKARRSVSWTRLSAASWCPVRDRAKARRRGEKIRSELGLLWGGRPIAHETRPEKLGWALVRVEAGTLGSAPRTQGVGGSPAFSFETCPDPGRSMGRSVG